MTLPFRPAPDECRQMEALLPPFVDGTASAADHARVAAHLGHCAGCRQAAAAQESVRHLLRARHIRLCGSAPAGLADAMRAAALRSTPPALGIGGRLTAVAAAAGVVVGLSAALVWGTGRSSVLLAAQLTLDHIKCFMLDGDDHGEHLSAPDAEARMQRDFGWSVPIPAPAARADVHLVAVRRCLYGEGLVAHVLYRVQDAPVSLFVMPGRHASHTDLAAFGRHAEVIERGGATYVIVAPARLADVAAFVGLEAE